ncbi:MucR family transcriptional regulator [Azospirillum ramasamyi]|nr:MucR family transcriptional regulator [Azospirillum ramasamyi]
MNQINENTPAPGGLLEMTSAIITAYVGSNHVQVQELPDLVKAVHAALAGVSKPERREAEAPLTPAVPVRRSVTPDYIVCLEDGKKLKMLKRHLRSTYGMSPDEYRAKWGLPSDYPMVAPNYAESRSKLALQIGLGRSNGRKRGRGEGGQRDQEAA